jgi:hypothetical protein
MDAVLSYPINNHTHQQIEVIGRFQNNTSEAQSENLREVAGRFIYFIVSHLPSTSSSVQVKMKLAEQNSTVETRVKSLNSVTKHLIYSFIREEDEEVAEISKSTCRATILFLEDATTSGVSMPSIAASASGAISLYWKYGQMHLVANIASSDLSNIVVRRFNENNNERSQAIESSRQVLRSILNLQNHAGNSKANAA